MLAGAIITLIGSLFLFLAAVGILRMPDFYNRMQTGTKATTLGAGLFLSGIAVSMPSWTGKIVLLIVFILFTNPVSSHALARASHFIGISIGRHKGIDDLTEQRRGPGGKEGDKWQTP